MELYDIQVLKADGEVIREIEMHYLNDRAAIRAGAILAEKQPFQVWRRSQCVFSGSAAQRLESLPDAYRPQEF